jgi:hypothetical protein
VTDYLDYVALKTNMGKSLPFHALPAGQEPAPAEPSGEPEAAVALAAAPSAMAEDVAGAAADASTAPAGSAGQTLAPSLAPQQEGPRAFSLPKGATASRLLKAGKPFDALSSVPRAADPMTGIVGGRRAVPTAGLVPLPRITRRPGSVTLPVLTSGIERAEGTRMPGGVPGADSLDLLGLPRLGVFGQTT